MVKIIKRKFFVDFKCNKLVQYFLQVLKADFRLQISKLKLKLVFTKMGLVKLHGGT